MNDIKSLFEPIKKLHETIRHNVVEACEQSALEDLSRIVADDEGDKHLYCDTMEKQRASETLGLIAFADVTERARTLG